MVFNRRKLYESNKKDPKAKDRNRGDVVFPAESSLVSDDKDHFPINSENQARNALARASQYKTVPEWYTGGSLKKLVTAVANKVHKKYPSIDITKAGRTPGKGPVNEKLNESSDGKGYNLYNELLDVLGTDKLINEMVQYLDDQHLFEMMEYIANNYNIKYDKEDVEFVSIIDYLKDRFGWDDMTDEQIQDIGDIINSGKNVKEKLEIYLESDGTIDNDIHYVESLIDEYEEAMRVADEQSESLNELDSTTYMSAAKKSFDKKQYNRYNQFSDYSNKKFNREIEDGKYSSNTIDINKDGFDLWVTLSPDEHLEYSYNINTDEMYNRKKNDPDTGEPVVYEPGDYELRLSDRRLINNILTYFRKFNPDSRYNDKSLWIK